MGWLEKTLIPQKDDSVGEVICKGVFGPIVAPLALLFDLEDALDGKSSSSSSDDNRGGGCHCNCESHKR